MSEENTIRYKGGIPERLTPAGDWWDDEEKLSQVKKLVTDPEQIKEMFYRLRILEQKIETLMKISTLINKPLREDESPEVTEARVNGYFTAYMVFCNPTEAQLKIWEDEERDEEREMLKESFTVILGGKL